MTNLTMNGCKWAILWTVVSCTLVQSFSPYSTVIRPALGLPAPRVHFSAENVKLNNARCQLKMAQSMPQPISDNELQSSDNEDPLMYELDLFTHMDRQGWINVGVIVGIAMAVLTKMTLVDVDIMRGWTAEEMAMRTALDNWSNYYDILMAAPIQTKAVTSATVYTIGDVIAQSTEGRHMNDLDRPRILRSMLAGLLGHGPLSHYWYQYSEVLFNDVFHWTEWWGFFPKVMVDQLTWGPFWNNCYILMLGAMKLDSLENIWSEMKRTTVPLIVSGLKLWPLAHCVTYGLIPVENRLLWVDIVEILWVTILATQAAGGAAAHGEEIVDEQQNVKEESPSSVPEPVLALNSADSVGMPDLVEVEEASMMDRPMANATVAYETR